MEIWASFDLIKNLFFCFTFLSDFTISHIKVQIFNIEANCNANRGETSDVGVGAKINPNAVVVIKRNSMQNDLRKETLRHIKKAFKDYSGTEDGFNYVCPYVTNELTTSYGSTKWACVVGEK